MSLFLKEYLNAKVSEGIGSSKNPINLKENLKNIGKENKSSVIAEIEGIHDIVTNNCTLYTKEAMESSLKSWTYPYKKALIMHHEEERGDVIGRIIDARVQESEIIKGSNCLFLVAEVIEEKSQEATLDERNKTVSVGVFADNVTCSICGEQLAGGYDCGHERGMYYDGKLCYWIVHSMQAKELSFVNVPSDQYAQVTKAYKVGQNTEGVRKSMSKAESLEKKDNTLDLKESKEDLENTNSNELQERKLLDNNGLKEDEIVKESEQDIIKSLHKDKKKLEDKLKEKAEELEEYKSKLNKLKDQVLSIQSLVTRKDEELLKETALRESLEEELSQHKEVVKEGLLKDVSNLRENLGLETDLDSFSGRSIDSLKDTIVDLKEQINNSIQKQTGTVLNEGFVDEKLDDELSKKSTVKKIVEEKEEDKRALDLNEAIGSIF